MLVCAVGGDNGGTALVALAEDLEEQIGAELVDGEIAEFVDDEDAWFEVLGHFALEAAVDLCGGEGTPEIVNTDQGSQFTAEEFTSVVLAKGCKLSMDGRGAWRDNVFVERLWRSVKYERVYLKAYDGVSAARADIADYMDWYNVNRPHSSLERLTPTEKYLDTLPPMKQAA